MTTKAQVQAWYAAGKPLIDGLQPDPPPPPTSELFTDYSCAYLGNKSYYTCPVDANGNATGPANFSHMVDQSTPTSGLIIWGAAMEHHDIRVLSNGETWGVTSGFEDTATHAFYQLEAVKVDWTNAQGNIKDMAPFFVFGQGDPRGIPEMPNLLPASGTCRVRSWFWICNPDKSRSRPGYSQQTITFGTSISCPSWQGGGPLVRPAIRFSEAWWDSAMGWVYGTAPTLPWSGGPDGPWLQPLPVNTTSYVDEAMGKGTGIMWRFQMINPVYRAGLVKAM